MQHLFQHAYSASFSKLICLFSYSFFFYFFFKASIYLWCIFTEENGGNSHLLQNYDECRFNKFHEFVKISYISKHIVCKANLYQIFKFLIIDYINTSLIQIEMWILSSKSYNLLWVNMIKYIYSIKLKSFIVRLTFN